MEPTAIEFLRKAKAICEDVGDCRECFLRDKFCGQMTYEIYEEADLVRKVMEYRLEDKDENGYEFNRTSD